MRIELKGWVCKDSDGYVALSEEKEQEFGWSSKQSIAKHIQYMSDEFNSGSYWNVKRGLGGTKSIIEDVSIQIYFTDSECSLDDATSSLIDKMYGTVTTHTSLEGYSEYTITGYCVEDFSIGGHDLEREISSHIGEYMIFVMED